MARFIASFSIAPVDTCGTSLSKYVAAAIKALEENGFKYELTPMATVVVGDTIDEIFNAIKVAHKAVEKMGVKRILVRINIDDRIDKPDRNPIDKIKAVEEKKAKLI